MDRLIFTLAESDDVVFDQVTAWLLLRRAAAAFWLYALILVGTLIWAVAEVGFAFWPLAPRGDVLVFACGSSLDVFVDAIRQTDPESAARIAAQAG